MLNKLFKMSLRRKIKRSITTPSLIKSYLNNNSSRKLHIGAGDNFLQGWLNTDIHYRYKKVAFLNAARVFPFEDNTFDYIFSEHQIEHITYPQAKFMLNECFRILKPNGKIRISTPNLKTLVSLCDDDKNKLKERYIHWLTDNYLPELAKEQKYSATYAINNAYSRWGHKFIYDYETLSRVLEDIGFDDFNLCDYGESSDEILKGIESHHNAAKDLEMVIFETFTLEATKK